MKAIIEFELPREEDAYCDAIEGAKWKEFAFNAEQYLMTMEATDTSSEGQRIYGNLLQFLRRERATSGLTFFPAAALRQFGQEHRARWNEILNSFPDDPGRSAGSSTP